MFNKLYKWIERLYLVIGTLLFTVLIAVVLLQVIARPLPISSPAWTEEVSRFLLIYLVAFGCALATGRRELVNVDLILNMLPRPVRKTLVVLLDLTVIGCSVTLFLNSFEYVESTVGRMATTVPISQAWITSAVLLITANITLFTVFNLIRNLFGIPADKQHDPMPDAAEVTP